MLEPRKKSISMRNTHAFDDWFTVWLPEWAFRQTKLEELYMALCRDKGEIVKKLKELMK